MDTSITVKVISGLIILLLIIRLLGKKELSQFTPFDFVYLLVIGGFLEESVYDEKVSVWEVLYTIILWAILIYFIETIVRKFDKMKPIIKGEPAIIVNDGELDIKELKRNKLESEQLRTMLRQQGIFSIKELKFAILEPNGHLSVLKNENYSPVTAEMLHLHPNKSSLSHLLVDEGKIKEKTLKLIGKNKEWLMNQLNNEGYENIKEIFYAEWSEVNGFTIKANS
ncbi:DUF421 domain-containing protein [Lederbergia galactosidilytica]|uniref:Membrane protein n=1 Tax=Lederbergia galactosidilytica TaxID=217031 RepID=A0A177ZJW1_9BACI|nr:DUF421 domain-containing protein [Lederbergia galactosidilytica]MBP1915016.1 uncharacterized membrane protein YcaP (DUF421 family) [Lederbergia galactosidilytica]OAK68257.1 membrane protein [Lederbergia galactosidilytica]